MDRLDRIEKILEKVAKSQAEADRQRAKDRAEAKAEAKAKAKAKAEAEAKAKAEKAKAEAEAKAKAEVEAKAKAEAKAEAEAEAKRRQEEWDRKFAKSKDEADRRLAENDRLISDLSKNIKGIGRSIGEITEAITVSSKIIESVNEFVGINVDSFLSNLEKTYKLDPKGALEGKNRRQFEIDGLAVGKSEAVVIEAKTKLKKGDVDSFIKGLDRFKEAFDEYADRDIYACVAFVRANEKTLAYAEKRGLFVVKATPPDVTLINGEGFKPVKFA